MDDFLAKCVSTINNSRALRDLPALQLEASYTEVATEEAENRIADAAADEDATDPFAGMYRKIGLVDAKYALIASGTRQGLLPAGLDAAAGIAATEDLEGKITAAAFDLLTAIFILDSTQRVIYDARLTHLGIGLAANSEGGLRVVAVFCCRPVDIRGIDDSVAVNRGCIIASARNMHIAAQRDDDAKRAPGTFEATAVCGIPHACIVGARVFADAVSSPLPSSSLPSSSLPSSPLPASVLSELTEAPREIPSADLAAVTARLRTFMQEGDGESDCPPVGKVYPWQLTVEADGTVRVPIPIATAHAEASVLDPTLQDGMPHRYVVQLLVRETGDPEKDDSASWDPIPYDAPQTDAEAIIRPHEHPKPAVFTGARVVVIYTDDLAAGEVQTPDAVVTAAEHPDEVLEARDAASLHVQPFSEVALFATEPAAGFTAQRLQPNLSRTPEQISYLPLLLSTADAPSLTYISSLILLSAETLEEAYDEVPAGYDIIPVNVAEMIKDSIAAASGAGDSTTVAPSAVFLAAQRIDESRLTGSVERIKSGEVLFDAALMATCVNRPMGEADATQVLPIVSPGYTLQTSDLMVTFGEGAGDSTLGDSPTGESKEEALPRIHHVRIALLTTSDKRAAIAANPLVAFVEETHHGSGDLLQADGVVGSRLDELRDFAGAGVSKEEEDQHRARLLDLLQAALAEQEGLVASNTTLQKQLAIYFSMRHSDDDKDKASATPAANRASAAAAAFAAADKEKRYREHLDIITKERDRLSEEQVRSESTAQDLKRKVAEKEAKCVQIQKAFSDFKREIARTAVHSQTGKAIPPPDLARFEHLESDKDDAVSRVQLQYIHLSTQVAKLEEKLKKREQVADGLAMIDFEQLKIENSTLNEKIEDRNEELGKLRKKATVAVQVLTHVREKLHFVSEEAARLGNELGSIDSDVSEQRAVLAAAKKERERVRVENDKARHAQGFAQNDKLAIDFERRKRDVINLRATIEDSQKRYKQLESFVGTSILK